MWEIFTGGMMPYDQMRNAEVVDFVCSSRKRLPKPDAAPIVIYSLMLECWDDVSNLKTLFNALKIAFNLNKALLFVTVWHTCLFFHFPIALSICLQFI